MLDKLELKRKKAVGKKTEYLFKSDKSLGFNICAKDIRKKDVSEKSENFEGSKFYIVVS